MAKNQQKARGESQNSSGPNRQTPTVFGPAKPVKVMSPKTALARKLNLRDPTDDELYESAIARIEELERADGDEGTR